MHVSSLGFRTDLALLTSSGSVVEDRGTHLVVRSPDNPSYFWGNFILLAEPPVPGGEREVVGAFHTEFPLADHVSIGIDTAELTDEARAAFEEAGLTVDIASVLTASRLEAPRFGAFVDGEVVATAGIFVTEDGVARYQSVETHPDHRRQGLAAAVVHAAGQHGLDRLGVRTLVIVADVDGEAIGVYRRLGFADLERQLMMEKRTGTWASPAA